MAVNFGILGNIAAPQVVGQLPQQPNQADQLAGRMMSGLAQGQQIQAQGLQVQQARQGMADQQALRQAAGQGEDKWLSTLVSQGKVDEAKQYQIHQLQYQNELLQNKTSVLDLNDKEHAKADRDNSINVSVMGQVSQLPADQQDAAYQKYRQDLTKKYPDIVMPEHFTPDSFASVMRTNQVMQDTRQVQTTNDVATLDQLQKKRDNLNATRQQLLAEGKPTQGVDKAIQETQDLIDKHTKNNDTGTAQKNVDYITGLKKAVDNATDPKAKQEAQDKLNLALTQLKQDESLWGQIKGKIADVVGGTAGGAVSMFSGSSAQAPSSKSYTLNGQPFDMEAAKKATGLSEEEIAKQAGLK